MADQICITLQMGFLREHVNLDRQSVDMSVIRKKANEFLERHFPPNKIPQSEQMFIFRHNYDSQNMLQLLQSSDQLTNGTVVEVVMSSKSEKPSLPHIVNVNSYYSPTFCDYCGEILVGLTKQGLKCAKCSRNFHKKCAFAAHNNCASTLNELSRLSESSMASASSGSGSMNTVNGCGLPHTFSVHTYKKPTICRYCGNLLVGLVKQGLQCRDCRVNVHRKCVKSVAFDCHAIEPMDLAEVMESPSTPSSQQSPELLAYAEMMLKSGHSDLDQMDTAELNQIPLGRIPGAASGPVRHKPSMPALMEGWMLHFTSSNSQKLRKYWRMDSRSIVLYQDDRFTRIHKAIPLSDILGLRVYDGEPLDTCGAPHCIEIQTAQNIYYVGENLEWYTKANVTPKMFSRESGSGMISAKKWLQAIRQALLPPQIPTKANGNFAATTPEGQETDKTSAFEFSAIYQVFPDDELGSGQFGKVYSGVHRATSRQVAIKAIEKDRSMSKKMKDSIKNEVSILQKLNHPGIITLEAMFEFSDRIFVVMEKMKADMLEMILTTEEGRLSERVTKFLIVQILKALKYLHEQDIAHCDLKPENVLLSSDETCFPQTKLCDFGYARIIDEHTFKKTIVGTPAYLAPEVLQKKGYNKSLDMWSVGVVIYVTLSGTFPFNEGEEIQDQIQNAAFMFPPNPWKDLSAQGIELISLLLQVKPEQRLNVDQCLAHTWLSEPQLYHDLRRLEAGHPVRYLTTPVDDQKWAHIRPAEEPS